MSGGGAAGATAVTRRYGHAEARCYSCSQRRAKRFTISRAIQQTHAAEVLSPARHEGIFRRHEVLPADMMLPPVPFAPARRCSDAACARFAIANINAGAMFIAARHEFFFRRRRVVRARLAPRSESFFPSFIAFTICFFFCRFLLLIVDMSAPCSSFAWHVYGPECPSCCLNG